jgi:hypothetical protein
MSGVYRIKKEKIPTPCEGQNSFDKANVSKYFRISNFPVDFGREYSGIRFDEPSESRTDCSGQSADCFPVALRIPERAALRMPEKCEPSDF